MRLLVVLVATAALSPALAGCAGGCPSGEALRAAFDAAQAFLDNPENHAYVQQVVGTIKGELEDATITVNGPAGQTRVQDRGGDFRIDAPYFSKESADTRFYGRNHLPGLVADFWASDPGDGLDTIAFSDYAATCGDYEGQDAIRFEWAPEDGLKRVLIVERAGEHRPLFAQVIDEAQQDNYRMNFDHDNVPDVSADASQPRWAATFYLEDVQSETNRRGGSEITVTMADDTEWVPLSELEVHLLNAQTGFVYVADDLESKLYDMADGDLFEFRDLDDNGLVSPGDEFWYTVGPGLDVGFWDEWADDYVTLVA